MASMKETFTKFKELYYAKQFDEALNEIAILEKKHGLPLDVLIIKGMCIQLGSEKSPYRLDDAESAFKKALEIDPDNLEALIEIGHYYRAIDDRDDIAKTYFEKAFSIARTRISEAIQGIALCISETNPSEALSFIEQAMKDSFDLEKIDWTVWNIKMLM
jgi:tetratricopeptide (TPR) repeat protein